MLILAVGIFLTIRLRGLQITKLPLAVRHIIANEKDGKDGEVSSFRRTLHGAVGNDRYR